MPPEAPIDAAANPQPAPPMIDVGLDGPDASRPPARPSRPPLRQFELVERVRRYKPDVDEDLLDRAYVYAMKKHGAQKRASGEAYITHPFAVAEM